MDCPACGAPRGIQDRVCRRCRLCYETGAKVDILPPRAAEGRAQPLRPPGPLSRAAAALRRNLERAPSLGRSRRALPGIVPGLGHVLAGERRRGALFAAGIIGLGLLGTLPLLGQTLQLAAMALAVAVHAISIFDLTPYRDDERTEVRIGAILVIQAALALLWWPVMTVLIRAFVEPILAIRGREEQAMGQATFPVAVLVLLVVVAAASIAGIGRILRGGRSST